MINRPSHLVTLPNAAVGFLQFAEIPMMARGSFTDGPIEGLVIVMTGIVDAVQQGRAFFVAQGVGPVATGAELRKVVLPSILLIQINGVHQRQIYGWFIAAIVENFSVLACRITNSLSKPPRFTTAANSDRWMIAMLMPSTMISMIR